MNLLKKATEYIVGNSGYGIIALFYLCVAVVGYDLAVNQNWSLLWWYPVGTVIMLVLSSAFYHRAIAHPTWKCPNWLRYPLTFISTGLGLGAVIPWVATHRQHHYHSEEEGDPHGPQYSLQHNLNIYLTKPNFMYVRDILRDPLYVAQLKYFWLWAAITIGLFSVMFGFVAWAFVYVTMIVHQVFLLYVGHIRWIPQNGWKGHLLGLIYSPEIYHLKHHDKPMNARLGKVDLPYLLLIKWFKHNGVK